MNYIRKSFSVYRVNYYSMLFTRAGKSLLSLIYLKDDSKLLKQQLLYVLWWYFITGAAGWNCIFLVMFALPIGTPNILNVFASSPLNLVWYSFLIEIWYTWNHSWSRSNQRLDLADFPWKLYFLIFSFYLLSSDSLSADHNYFSIKPLFHSHF